MAWYDCTTCTFSAADETPDRAADIMIAHYLGHMAEQLKRMSGAQAEQLALIRTISTSAFLNPRHPGEGAAERVQRVNGGQ